jgi:ADP-ribose 1''-phosphate phosphatase
MSADSPTPQFPAPTSSKPATQTISLTNHTGDIFAAPDHTVLIHACNTKGEWGAGIAVAFKTAYPNAYNAYREHCLSSATTVQTGTCLLIAPCETGAGPKHWIACLFTSAEYGRKQDGPDEILKNTELAVRDLLVKLKQAKERGEKLGSLRMCKINSGKFGVQWERTERVLEGVRLEEVTGQEIDIWDR